MQRLTLLCHGPAAAAHRIAFPADEPLDDRARPALAALRPGLSGADRCFTSPLLRARQTAEALHPAAREAPALRDLDLGRWRARTLAEIQAAEPDAVAAWRADPEAAPHGGESRTALEARVRGWLDELTAARGHTLCVTHAAVVRAAIIAVLGASAEAFWRIDVAPLGLTDLRFDGRRWAVRALNVTQG